jgi:hypothetical protein
LIGFEPIESFRGSRAPFREHGPDQIAALAAEQFDDQPWPVRPSTLDEVSEATAQAYLVDQLRAGPEFGHTRFTIEPAIAEEMWRTFRGFFAERCRFYQVWLGDPRYTYLGGVVILDDRLVGVVNVVQGD